jgi:hypothetical protein
MQTGCGLGIGLMLVGGEQDVGAGDGSGLGNALVQQAQELGSFLVGEVDLVALEHGRALPQIPPI